MSNEMHPEVEIQEEDLIDLVDDSGRHLKFFHVGSTQFLKKWYAFFMPAEEIEGVDEETVVIFQVEKGDGGEEILLPVDDELLLEQVYEQFCREMEEEADSAEAEELEGGCCCHHHGHEDGECDCHEDGECDCHGEGHNHGECDCHGEGRHHHGEGCCHGHGEGKKGKCKKHN